MICLVARLVSSVPALTVTVASRMSVGEVLSEAARTIVPAFLSSVQVSHSTPSSSSAVLVSKATVTSAGSRAIISMSDSVERVSVASGLSPTCVIGKSTLSPVLESVTRSVPVRL